MGNQYSITVSPAANAKLEYMKKKGIMPSRAIDMAINVLGIEALMTLYKTSVRTELKHGIDLDE